jgi:hypothetical protein
MSRRNLIYRDKLFMESRLVWGLLREVCEHYNEGLSCTLSSSNFLSVRPNRSVCRDQLAILSVTAPLEAPSTSTGSSK